MPRTFSVVVTGALLMAGCAGAQVHEGADTVSSRQGARVWSRTCNNCHNLRQGTEYAARDWPVIINHMRTRAGLTRSQAEAVAEFLRQVAEDAGESGSAEGSGVAPSGG